MIKTKKGKTIISGNIFVDVEDLSNIMMTLEEKYNLEFLEASVNTIIKNDTY